MLVPVAVGVGGLLALRRVKSTTVPAVAEDPPAASVGEPTADSLDKDQLDQLHAATLKAADSCFELKKLCATVLVPTGVLVSTFTDKRLDAAVFIAALLVIFAFWMADVVSYYYQRKLREGMEKIWVRRAARCAETYPYSAVKRKVGWLHAAFNLSMVYYWILGSVTLIAFAFYLGGAFTSVLGGTK